MYAALVLCLVGIVVSQKPVPCTSPPQWEARLIDTNEQQKFFVRGKLSYDSVYRRERLIDEVEQGGEDNYYESLSLFDSQVEFIYNFKTKNCSRYPITRQWRDFGIRSDARSYGEAYIGSSAFPGTGVLVTIWYVSFCSSIR